MIRGSRVKRIRRATRDGWFSNTRITTCIKDATYFDTNVSLGASFKDRDALALSEFSTAVIALHSTGGEFSLPVRIIEHLVCLYTCCRAGKKSRRGYKKGDKEGRQSRVNYRVRGEIIRT